eukprot:g15694.t1
MGSRPRRTEAEGMEALRLLIEDNFDTQQGHELRADVFVCPKSAPGSSQGQRRWMPLQLKVTGEVTAAWRRKLRHILKRQQSHLRDIVLVGISLKVSDECLVHLVHRNRNYNSFDAASPQVRVPRAELSARIRALYDESVGTCLASPERSFVFSQATLAEAEARADFVGILAGSDVVYELALSEYDCVDGKTGKNYAPDDADCLLLHVRSDITEFSGEPFQILQSALIPFPVLQEHGYLYEGDEYQSAYL